MAKKDVRSESDMFILWAYATGADLCGSVHVHASQQKLDLGIATGVVSSMSLL